MTNKDLSKGAKYIKRQILICNRTELGYISSKQNKDFMMKTKLQAENAGKNFELTCSVKTDGNSAVFMPELTNIAKERMKAVTGKISFSGLDLGGKFSVIECGNSMGYAAERYDFPGCTHHIRGSWYMLFRFAPDRYLLAGTLRSEVFTPEWELYDGKFSLTLHADCRFLDPSEKLGGDIFTLIEGSSQFQVVRRFRELIIERNPRAPRTGTTRWQGFGMWQEYTGDQLFDAFKCCQKSYSQDLNIMQVDAGYCAWGDWLDVDPEVFPNGMKGFVEQIRKEGAQTGLWAAPCLAEIDSKIFREHPEFFLKKADGTTYLIFTTGRLAGILDFSQDEVCKWWEHVVTVMRREWGITYFKFDFISEEIIPLAGKNSMTPMERYVRFINTTDKVCGNDSYVMGCNAVYSASFGRCDAFRLGADISSTWARQKNSARTCSGHIVFHSKEITGDCDYLELRGPDTPTPLLGHKKGSLTMDEAKLWAQYETMFNHITLPSDDPHVLEDDRKVYVRKVLSTKVCNDVFVMDHFFGDNLLPPSLYLAKRGNDKELHFFNWNDEPRTLRILDKDGKEFCFQKLEPHTAAVKIIDDPRSYEELASDLTPDIPLIPRKLFQYESKTFETSGLLTPVPLGPAAKYSITEDRHGGMMVHEGLYGRLVGKQTFCGIPFDLSSNRGIESYYGGTESIEIPFGKTAKNLYLLHSIMYATNGELLDCIIHYTDGSQSKDTIVLKEDIGNSNFYYSTPWKGTRAHVAWCDIYSGDVLYAFKWVNPHPEKTIAKLEFAPLRQPQTWNLLGITAETN